MALEVDDRARLVREIWQRAVPHAETDAHAMALRRDAMRMTDLAARVRNGGRDPRKGHIKAAAHPF